MRSKNKIFNGISKIDDTYYPELRGKNILNYVISWKGEFIKYGEWLAEPRQPSYFIGEKILIRQIPASNRLVVAYTDEYFVVDQTVYIGKLQSTILNNLTTLALLNSKLIFWFFQNISNEFDKLFPKIKTKEFKELPVYNFSSLTEQSSFIDLTTDSVADTGALEAEIDRLVYTLYGLTEEEIAIVEG